MHSPTPLIGFFLVPVPSEAEPDVKAPISLKPGVHELGRGSAGQLGIEDSRLSRKQIRIEVDPAKEHILVQSLGVNSSYIRRHTTGEIVSLKKEVGPVAVNHGDVIYLLRDLFPHRVQIETRSNLIPTKSASATLVSSQTDAPAAAEAHQKSEHIPPPPSQLPASNSSQPAASNGAAKKPSVSVTVEKVEASALNRSSSAVSALEYLRDMFPKLSEATLLAAFTDSPGATSSQMKLERAIDKLLRESVSDAGKDRSTPPSSPRGEPPKQTNKHPLSEKDNKEQQPLTKKIRTEEKETEAAAASSSSCSSPAPAVTSLKKTATPVSSSSHAAASSSSSSSHKVPQIDEEVARSLAMAMEESEAHQRRARQLEADALAQQEIIRLLMEEKAEVESKAKKLTAIDTDRMYMPGEREALAGSEIKRYTLFPERGFESNAQTYHFRTAESQFHRLLGAGASFHVTKVEYIVNPPLVKKFEERRLKMAERMEWNETKPILCFHGTAAANISSIVRTNFDLKKIGANTGNSGYYGKGVYFSESTSYAMGYVRAGSQILLCQVLLGRSYKAPLRMGCSLEPGFDSHISVDGQEIVIFEADQILPCYIVHYAAGAARVADPWAGVASGYAGTAGRGRGFFGAAFPSSYDEYDESDDGEYDHLYI